jgi:hypothetical protein
MSAAMLKTLWEGHQKTTSSNTFGNRAAESSSANKKTLPKLFIPAGFTK